MISNNNPISIELIASKTYKISIKLDNWEVSKIVSDKAIDALLSSINSTTGLTKISEAFNCSGEDSKKIQAFWEHRKNWDLCSKCKFKWVECYNCVIKCDSPLERDLLLELRKQNLQPIMQRRFNKDGTYYEFPTDIDFDNILTIPDFYIETINTKLCIYADGHTYHERTEKQALRDRNIDRELQKLGFTVLRYTGNEIRKNCSLVVQNIISNLD
jgi:very-short-patch-repair endonuclease